MKTYHDITGDGGSNVADQVAAQKKRLTARMTTVDHVVAVMSGKGGVGKSTVTVNLAAAMAQDGRSIGIVDADINGPSIAKMAGVRDQQVAADEHGMQPVESALGVKVMSMDLFLPDDETPVVWEAPTQHDAYTWRGTMEAGAVREFLADTDWGVLDVLLIDLPPGTDKLPTLVDLLPALSGTIVVTIPAAVSQLVVSKSIQMAKQWLQTPVIGLVENMTEYVCPHCGEKEPLFPANGKEQQATEWDAPLLGRIPFDPRMAVAADEGMPFVRHHEALPAARALRQVAEDVNRFLSQRTEVQE